MDVMGPVLAACTLGVRAMEILIKYSPGDVSLQWRVSYAVIIVLRQSDCLIVRSITLLMPSNQVRQVNKHGLRKCDDVGHSEFFVEFLAQTFVFATEIKDKVVSARTVCGNG